MKIFVSHTVVDCEVEPEAWVVTGLVKEGDVLVMCCTWQQVRCLFSQHLKVSNVLDSLDSVADSRSGKTEGMSTEISSGGRNT